MVEEFVDQLARSEIFSDLETGCLSCLAAIATPVSCKKGQEIFAEGDGGDAFYQIVEGTVAITKKDEAGTQREVAVLKENDILGEMALLTDSPRSATARCLTDVRLLRILRSDFQGQVKAGEGQSYQILSHLVGVLCRRLRDMNEHVSRLLQKQAPRANELAALRERLTKEWSF